MEPFPLFIEKSTVPQSSPSQQLSGSGAKSAGEEHDHQVSAPPPTTTVPALHFGSPSSEGRPLMPTASAHDESDGSDNPAAEHPSSGFAEESVQWTRQRNSVDKNHASLAEEEEEGENNERGRHEMRMGDPPALRRPSALFDTALATEALFARLQQGQQRVRDPPPPPPPTRPTESEPPARHAPSTSISSVLGRPPTAPLASASVAAAAASPSSYASTPPNPHPTLQRELSSPSSPQRESSSFRGLLRSPSNTSTTDYVDIEHKQNELRYAVEHHVRSLERSLALRDEEAATLTSRLRKLEEDYQFNYNLIAERDAALEEASAQLQRLYRELKRLTEEAARTGKKVEVAEAELKAARHRVRAVEEERDAAVRQVQKDYAVKERHLLDGIRAKEAALEQEQKQQHEWYKEQARLLEEERTALADRSASISVEAEERCKQQVDRLQSELTVLQRELKAARQTKVDDDRRVALLEEAKGALLHELQIHQERHEASLQEAALAKKEVEERLVRVTAEAEKRATAAEAATREESARASRLELERTCLHATLAEAQERIQHLTLRFDDDVARYTKERQTLLRRNDDAVAAKAAVEQSLQDTQRELEKQRRLAAEDAERLGSELERSRSACEAAKLELVTTKEKCEKWEAAAARLEAEVRRWKGEEDKTATSGRQERSAWEEKCRQTERQAQLAQEEAEQATKRQQIAVEKARGEVVHLTRELHASEAARRTLEDQFHLLEDYKEERSTFQTLRMEKEQLQKRVVELERANEEVRQQVAAFTVELQNDPILKAAKESQQRLVELQQELAEAKADQQLLRDTVKEKEDALVRCETEMLRVQVLMGDEPSTALDAPSGNNTAHLGTAAGVGLSDQVSRALQRQQQQMRSEYSKMRQSYEEMVRELDLQRRRRRHRSAAPVPRPSSASSSSSGSSSTTVASSNAHRSKKRLHRQSREKKHNDANAGNVGQSSVALPPVLPDSKAAYLTQETEVWRQRCVQLEQQLHTLLRERDQLKKELQLAKQDVVALGTEKQSLIDLNSLLKAQLREAYRMRVGDGDARSSTTAADSAPSKNLRISPELLAAALQALEESENGRNTAKSSTQSPQHHINTTGDTAGNEIRHSAAAGPNRETPVVHSTRGFRATATAQQVSPASAPDGGFTAQAAQKRLAALEREIDDVRGQLNSTASSQQTRQAVVRRGNAAVRHYGYGS
ncbi:hypothetical protein ABB37_06202 [Leptomonas pyrrhocoris]|uniref:200 kDa antigen p200 n=1 Tax=Leptomonas pyrrhocoris TaxID=157538 RepID=A0A0N1J4N2_LEPPY|nr:hypothetical protein ABB37_06202 [Leptomonas pyrrhocoris]KPA78602.1 hypothetical protein ABB37_06202 [Leptomonas pyrrhocoris]|eukprot:XP_015657041.1 hypothetical protein ABB37_06202 [Leptomonas pyrrhocoris]